MGIKYRIDKDFFKTWSQEMAYVLGFITADGSLEDASYLRGRYIRIYSKDKDILEKIKMVMNSGHRIVAIEPKQFLLRGKQYQSKRKYMLRIGNHELYNDLIKLGITPRKSKTIQLLSPPKFFSQYYLRGYLDGDGCIYCNTDRGRLRVIFTSGSKKFLEKLSTIINALLNLEVKKVSRNKHAFQIRYSTRESIPLLRYIYSDIRQGLYLQRKYKVYSDFIDLYSKWNCSNGATVN